MRGIRLSAFRTTVLFAYSMSVVLGVVAGLALGTAAAFAQPPANNGPANNSPANISPTNTSPAASSFDNAKHFENAVRPLLVEHCISCHGPDKAEGALRLDRSEDFAQGGESGSLIDQNQWSESLLIQAVKHLGPEMPPNRKLADEQIAALETWVREGARWPDYAQQIGMKNPSQSITPEDRDYWFFRPIVRTTPRLLESKPGLLEPKPDSLEFKPGDAQTETGTAQHSNPIDAFIEERLLQHQLTISPNADFRTLVRRIYLDLVGVPPSIEELARIEASNTSYEQLVDQLLQDPRYGERWGRYWLDLVRFAESDGYKQDDFRPTAYRYRDYVVQALNEDIPYGQFIAEQICGDEIDPNSDRMNAATGFLRHWIYEYNQRDVRTQWDNILNDLTDVTGEVFLGLGFSCARCHDHKFDPILQQDYYRLQAFFAPIEPRYDIPADRQAYAQWQTAEAAWQERARAIREEMQTLEKPIRDQAALDAIEKFPPDVRPALKLPPQERPPEERAIAILAGLQIDRDDKGIDISKKLKDEPLARWKELKAQYDELVKERPAPAEMALTVRDGSAQPPTVRIPGKASAGPLTPGVPFVLADELHTELESKLTHKPSLNTTGQRTALAQWIASEHNPMTWRVIANRIWQHHFGKGLVANASDFGRLGTPPSHPELLDYLASELIDNQGRLKALHRLIVTSDTYKQTSYPAQQYQGVAIDSDNTLLWRFKPRRLDAEQLRDSILQVCGSLDAKAGGPSDAKDSARRSIYQRVLRNAPHTFLASFDAPDGSSSVALRNTTTTALQSLVLTNSPWMLDRAEELAKALIETSSTDSQRIQLAFERILFRPPTAEEERWVSELLLVNAADANAVAEATAVADTTAVAEATAIAEANASEQASERLRRWTDICHALLNTNSFLYIE